MFWNYKGRVLIPIIGVLLFASTAGYIVFNIILKETKLEKKKRKLKLKHDLDSSIEVKIPRNSVGAVMGRDGLKIKFIENTTNTIVTFQDNNKDKTDIACVIQGTCNRVDAARKLILQCVEEVPVLEYFNMNIPNFAVANVIKIAGSTFKDVSGAIGAYISTDNKASFTSPCSSRQIIIKGTHDQIKAAEKAIINIIDREMQIRNQMNCSVASISQRTKDRYPDYECHQNGNVKSLSNDDSFGEVDKFIEGIVSAVDNPCHFWFQIKSPDIIKLEKLVEDMTAYYNIETNRELHAKVELNYEDIVAAQFTHDQKWYRGIISKHEENDNPLKYVIYFVDFGDTDEVDKENICELKTDFLQLKFQAIEACLDNINPDSITSDAMNFFTELMYVNLQDSVQIRITGYKNDTKVGIPYVEVVNKNGVKEINVAKEMVNRGFAKPMF